MYYRLRIQKMGCLVLSGVFKDGGMKQIHLPSTTLRKANLYIRSILYSGLPPVNRIYRTADHYSPVIVTSNVHRAPSPLGPLLPTWCPACSQCLPFALGGQTTQSPLGPPTLSYPCLCLSAVHCYSSKLVVVLRLAVRFTN